MVRIKGFLFVGSGHRHIAGRVEFKRFLFAVVSAGQAQGQGLGHLPVEHGVDGVFGHHRQRVSIAVLVVLHIGEVGVPAQGFAVLAQQRNVQVAFPALDHRVLGVVPLQNGFVG
ncbi:hypothetical protein D3C78_1600100 [compost metagenome]